MWPYPSSLSQLALALLQHVLLLVQPALQVLDGLVGQLQGRLAVGLDLLLPGQLGQQPLPAGGGGEPQAQLVDDPVPGHQALLGLRQRRFFLLQLLRAVRGGSAVKASGWRARKHK